jgi:AraC-like DNA-binding protein
VAIAREASDGVRRARDYLEEHVSERVSLERLAGVAGMDRFRLLRAFKAAVGATPHRYQLALRVTIAQRLLTEAEPLADVASLLGFADQSHFGRWFRRLVGCTPGEYRQRR